jgi:hypothetical protein
VESGLFSREWKSRKKEFFWHVNRDYTDCIDLRGCNIGICVKGRCRGTIEKQVDFILKNCRILMGV